MSVGDLKNNLRKLQTGLRGIKYEKDVDLDSLSKGVVGSFLPIYHFLFLDFSRPIAEHVANLDIELSGKTDLRFVEAMYKVLREVFVYKPPITKEQFFANGFVERKVIMCTEVIQLVKDKHRSLAPKSIKSRPGTGTGRQAAKLGPRQVSGPPSSKTKNVSNTAEPPEKLQTKPPKKPNHSPPDIIPVQVVNEIRQVVASSVPNVFSEKNMDDSFNSVILENRTASMEMGPPIETKVIREEGSSKSFNPSLPWEGMRAVVVTSREQESKQEAGYNPARYKAAQEEDTDEEEEEEGGGEDVAGSEPVVTAHPPYPQPLPLVPGGQRRPIDMIAMTPARPVPARLTAAGLSAPPADGKAPDKLGDSLNKLEKSVSEINSRVLGLENRLSVVEGLLSIQQQRDKEAAGRRGDVVTPEQLETLLARMTLIENRVALVGAQKSSNKVISQPRPASVTMETAPSVQESQEPSTLAANPHMKDLHAPSFGFSPIHGGPTRPLPSTPFSENAPLDSPVFTAKGTDPTPQTDVDRRWSSTPISVQDSTDAQAAGDRTEAPKKHATEIFADEESSTSQAERIRLMLHNTKNMLNITHQDTPIKN